MIVSDRNIILSHDKHLVHHVIVVLVVALDGLKCEFISLYHQEELFQNVCEKLLL